MQSQWRSIPAYGEARCLLAVFAEAQTLLLNLYSPFLACHQFYSHVRNIHDDYITLLHYSFVDINGDI